MQPITYEAVKLLHEERLRRSLSRYEFRRRRTEASAARQDPEKLAEVVEITFATDREHDSIGA